MEHFGSIRGRLQVFTFICCIVMLTECSHILTSSLEKQRQFLECWLKRVLACREGATLSGRMCAYKILNAAPELARTKQREPSMALA